MVRSGLFRLDLVEPILVNKFPQLSFEEVRQILDLKEVNLSENRFVGGSGAFAMPPAG
jgi:predicted transposase YdaD